MGIYESSETALHYATHIEAEMGDGERVYFATEAKIEALIPNEWLFGAILISNLRALAVTKGFLGRAKFTSWNWRATDEVKPVNSSGVDCLRLVRADGSDAGRRPNMVWRIFPIADRSSDDSVDPVKLRILLASTEEARQDVLQADARRLLSDDDAAQAELERLRRERGF